MAATTSRLIPEDRVPAYLLAIGKGIEKELQRRYKNVLQISGLVCHDLTTDTGFCYYITVYYNNSVEEMLALSVNTSCVEVSQHIRNKIKESIWTPSEQRNSFTAPQRYTTRQFEYADPDLINNLYLTIHEYYWPRHLT